MGITPESMIQEQEQNDEELLLEYLDPTQMTLAQASEYFKDEPVITKANALNAYDRLGYLRDSGYRIIRSIELAHANGLKHIQATQYIRRLNIIYPDLMTRMSSHESIYVLAENWILQLEQYYKDYMQSKGANKCRKTYFKKRSKNINTIVHHLL